MKKFIVILAALAGFAVAANASTYVVDESSIDALFTEASAVAPAATPAPAPGQQLIDDSQTCEVVALVVDMVAGGIGLHRLILGTKPINMLWYFLTFGGIFGIVPLVDWIMLLVDLINGQTSWLNNPAFIMWL